MRLSVVFVSTLLLTPAYAQSDCVWIKDSAKRLECYDKASAGIGGNKNLSGAKVESTAEPLETPHSDAPEKPTEFKVVEAADLAIGTNKYVGKNIEIHNIKCVYADVGDYRCTTGSSVSIFTKAVQPVSLREYIETKCDKVRKALLGSTCLFAARFTYTEVTRDIVSGFQERTILHPDIIKLGRLKHR